MTHNPQDLLRAVVQPLGESGKALVQVRIGDLFELAPFKLPSILMEDNQDWTKGELRQALDSVVVSMCHKIVAHGSMFKHRADCTLSVPASAACPKCQLGYGNLEVVP